MEIELTQGFKSVIDDEDFALVGQFKWRINRSRGVVYAGRSVNGGCMLMHRLITGAKPGEVVDHIDHDTLNNRRSNLRVCSHAENMRNSKLRAHSKTGVKGVMLEKRKDGVVMYRATVRHDHKRYRKWFRSLPDAASWAEVKRRELHAEFAYSREQDVR